jgi:RNA-directed DNA polymerase
MIAPLIRKHISDKFSSLTSVEEFVVLLNYANRNIVSKKILEKDKDKNIQIELKTLSYYAYHKKNSYSSFEIPKKSGGTRTILAPEPYLKLIQTCINTILQIVFTPHHCANGFAPLKSIATNGIVHTNKNYVLNIDLKDFFPSVEFRRIKTVLELKPFNLKDNREPIGFLIANLCCLNGVLPQGAPTSPVLTNIVCQRLDRKLYQLAISNNSKYSRYADDITFSSNQKFNKTFKDNLKTLIEFERFKINEKKTRIYNSLMRQEVTGLVVNEKLNLPKPFIRSVRAMLNNWNKKGLDFAKTKFESDFVTQKASYKKIPSFRKSLKGKIEFIGMIRGKEDSIYKNYLATYNKLNKVYRIKAIMNTWKNQGIEVMIKDFYK